MKLIDIKRMGRDILLNQSVECSCVEYKKSVMFKDKILKTVCAFANNYMNDEVGFLFIGVEEIDNKETGEKAIPKRPISGIKEAKIENVENEIKALLANIHPRVNYHIITDMLDGEYYLVVAVEGGNNGPYETSEKAKNDKEIRLKPGRYIRVGRESRLPNTVEEFELLKKFANFSFSSNLNDVATIDDLSYEYMKEYLLQTGSKRDVREMSKLDIAKSMGLISESEYGGYRAKNFAVLMFSEMPNKYIPNAHVEIIREIDGTDKMESKVFDGPIWMQVKQVVKYFKDNIMTSYTIRESNKMEHRIVYNYPLTAFEELATNAIIHKEYDNPEYVGIYIYKDRISFVNHNRPLPPVTIESLNRDRSFDRRQYLNKELKNMFFALNLIESYGSGIRRAKDSLLENGSPDLKFYPDNEDDNYTNVVMKINEEFLKDLEFKTTKENLKTTKENAKTTKENAETTKEMTNTTKENTETTKEMANTTKENVKTTKENINNPNMTQEKGGIAQETEGMTQEKDKIAQESTEMTQEKGGIAQETEEMTQEKGGIAQETEEMTQEKGGIAQETEGMTQEKDKIAQESTEMTQEKGGIAQESTEMTQEKGGIAQETESCSAMCNVCKSLEEEIVAIIIIEPDITAGQIAKKLNVSFEKVRYRIRKLKVEGKIKRIGSTKSGCWVVMK